MKLHTEKEQITQHQFFAFKLRNLYTSNPSFFKELTEYIPYSVHLNRIENLDLTYANNQLLGKGQEMEQLIEKGSSYLPEISCRYFLQQALKKIDNFRKLNDYDNICSCIQLLKVNDKMHFFYSNKLFLDQNLYFNLSNFTQDLGMVGKVFENIFKPFKDDLNNWQKFKTLTKQEKRILKEAACGKQNKEISDDLFISIHTLHTHKKNIYRKLDVNNITEMIRYAMALDLLDEY